MQRRGIEGRAQRWLSFNRNSSTRKRGLNVCELGLISLSAHHHHPRPVIPRRMYAAQQRSFGMDRRCTEYRSLPHHGEPTGRVRNTSAATSVAGCGPVHIGNRVGSVGRTDTSSPAPRGDTCSVASDSFGTDARGRSRCCGPGPVARRAGASRSTGPRAGRCPSSTCPTADPASTPPTSRKTGAGGRIRTGRLPHAHRSCFPKCSSRRRS